MANTIQTISKVSDLPIINKVWDGMKTIIAYDRKNYLLDVSKIKGKRIIDMSEFSSSKSGGENIIYIKFDDGTTERLLVYNGTQGETGDKGKGGVEGSQGESGFIDERKDGITGTIYIINNSTTQDPNSPWSAYRGKDMNDKIYELNETFITEEQFDILFNNITYIYAEYSTSSDNQDVRIFSNDVNDHKVYKKYWTYEDEGLETYYIYNPISDTYDTIAADLWKDIYLGKTEGYFLATTSMLTDETELFYYNKETNLYSPITKVVSRREIKNEDGTTTIIDRYLGDKEIDPYYLPEVDASVHATYSQQTGKWTFNLNASSELVPEVYKTIDGEHYTQLTDEEVLAINPAVYAEYFYKDGDTYKVINNISAYLAVKDTRYYKRTNGNIHEVKLSDISEDNYDDYLIVTKNKLSNTYTYERHHASILFDEMVYFVDTVTLSSIDLYYYTDSREYYRVSLERTPIGTDEETGEIIYETTQVYTKIEIPNWIYAEFVTTDEDQLTLVLSHNEDLGEEDNTETDDSEESLNPYVKTKEISRIVPGIKKDLYHKNIDGTYTLVDLNKDSIYSNAEYYILTGEYWYEPISGEYAISNGISELYNKNLDNTYSLNISVIVNTNTYYIKHPSYERVLDAEEYLSTYNLVLFYGEPQLLPISIYPIDNTRSYVSIEYDSDKIKFYEDGRIAATIGDNFDTTIRIRSIENPNIYGLVNVKLTTPVKSINLNESNPIEVNIGEDAIIKYIVSPSTAENKNVIWSSSSSDALDIEQINETSIKLTGRVKNNKVTITGNAADGFGAKKSFDFEVIQPATSINWNQENIEYHEEVKYTTEEVDTYNTIHYAEIESGELERMEYGTVKTPAYYSMVVLLGKDYMFTPEVSPEDTSYPEVNWSSSNLSIASVIEKNIKIIDSPKESHLATIEDINDNKATEIGEEVIDKQEVSHNENRYFLTSTAIGEVIITGKLAKYPELPSIIINVRVDQSIEEINVYPSTLSLNVDTKKKLVAEILPDTAVNGTISWRSNNDNIVTVSPTGTITAIRPGSTAIIAHAEDGSEVEGRCNVTVTIPAKDINLSGNTTNGIIYVGIGQTTTITPEITYDSSYSGNEKLGINWSSSNTNIATIDSNGVVTGIELGKTTIIANAKDGSGVFGTIQVQVIKLIESISFTDMEEVELELGNSLVLVPNITPVDASNEIVIWESSDESIAKVKESGIVYALSSGNATITATTTDGSNLTATCNITIL